MMCVYSPHSHFRGKVGGGFEVGVIRVGMKELELMI